MRRGSVLPCRPPCPSKMVERRTVSHTSPTRPHTYTTCLFLSKIIFSRCSSHEISGETCISPTEKRRPLDGSPVYHGLPVVAPSPSGSWSSRCPPATRRRGSSSTAAQRTSPTTEEPQRPVCPDHAGIRQHFWQGGYSSARHRRDHIRHPGSTRRQRRLYIFSNVVQHYRKPCENRRRVTSPLMAVFPCSVVGAPRSTSSGFDWLEDQWPPPLD